MNNRQNSEQRFSDSDLLRLENISKHFGGVAALDGVSFSVARGQIVGLIGPNGAGKTTLFNCITGLDVPDKGSMDFVDTFTGSILLNRLYPDLITAKGIARTFQTIRLFKHLTALENVLVGAHLHACRNLWEILLKTNVLETSEQKLKDNALRLLDLFGLKGKAYELAKNLAYGHQRKLEIARALASNPRLLLLDEPAAGMNPREKEELLELIRAIRSRDVTILLIEHDMRVVMPISDRVVVLDYGKKIAEGTPREIQDNPRVIEAYLGKARGADA